MMDMLVSETLDKHAKWGQMIPGFKWSEKVRVNGRDGYLYDHHANRDATNGSEPMIVLENGMFIHIKWDDVQKIKRAK